MSMSYAVDAAESAVISVELPVPTESIVFALHKPRKLTIARLPGRKAGSGVLGRRGCFSTWLTELETEASVPERSLFPIGRLDKETRGLLLVTNDGDLAYVLTRQGVCRKRYVARCRLMDATLKSVLDHQNQNGDEKASHAPCWDAFAALVRKHLCEDGVSLSDQRPHSSRESEPILVHFSAVSVLDVRIQRRVVPASQPKVALSRKQRCKAKPESTQCNSKDSRLDDNSHQLDACDIVRAASLSVSSQQADDSLAKVFEHIEVDIAVDITVGQYRVVRRALAAVGLPVFALSRSTVGPLELADLGIDESQHVRLGEATVAQLWETAGGRAAVDAYKAVDKGAARDGHWDCNGEGD